MIKPQVLQDFVNGKFEQVHCEKCENTFLTNVYAYDEHNVLLEKRSLGLEYYCGAIQRYGLAKVPDIQRIGVLDEMNNILDLPCQEEIYSGNETELRFIYVMEKLNHLDEADAVYFDRCVMNLDWQTPADREKIFMGVIRRYNAELARAIEQLFDFYSEHADFMVWDLHGDNLMRRVSNDEIVILDPYTRKI